MLLDLHTVSTNFRWADVIDLAVVTLLFSLVFQWLRRRSNKAFLVVVVGLVSLYFVSHWLRMYLTLGLFRMGLSVAVIGIIVIFQNDLRHGFERLAAWQPFSRRKKAPPQESFLATLIEAVTLLASEKIGALIVLPARQPLERLLHGGEKLEGKLSVPLLHSIFHSHSRGHDGAVLLEDRLVQRFGVHLPLSTNLATLGPGGTRHAAALGLAEQSDALVIVVSEERGTVSLARNGQIEVLSEGEELAERLKAFYQKGHRRQTASHRVKQFAGQLLSFVLGFAAAVFFWLMFAFQLDTVQRVVDQIPVDVHGLPADWVIESVSPDFLRVNVMGSERAFTAYDWSGLRVTLDLRDPSEGQQTIAVNEEAMKLPGEITLVRAEPSVVRVTAYKTQTVTLPIQIQTYGRLPDGWEKVSEKLSQPSMTVKVREDWLSEIKAIPTRSINLAGVVANPTQKVPLLIPDGVWPADNLPGEVQVTFELRKAEGGNQRAEGGQQ